MVTVFQYWDSGFDGMPDFIKTIYKHNFDICEKNNVRLVLITDENITDYITPHPRFKSLAHNHKSDMTRYYVLHKYGGFWLDTDVIIIKDLNILFDIPFILCVLTDLNHQQAYDRSGGKMGNKGVDCAIATIELIKNIS